jgi:hypothetical protein
MNARWAFREAPMAEKRPAANAEEVGAMTKLGQLHRAVTARVGSRSLAAWGLGHIVQALNAKRAAHRAYKSAVDDCITVLLSGFPDGLSSAKHQLRISSIVRRSQVERTQVRACAVQVTILLLRKMIGRLSKAERQAVAEAFLRNDVTNLTYKGLNRMFQVVQRLNVSPALVSYLTAEVAGQLRGISQHAIFSSWVDTQVGGAIGKLRKHCIDEAKSNRLVWQ